MKTICATGHRPNKLGGYGKVTQEELVSLAAWGIQAQFLHEGGTVISGMALGWDQAVAAAAIRLGLPLHAYIPCRGQETLWPHESQQYYNRLLRHCDEIVRADVPYSPEAMMQRNRDMVDASDVVLALWDGTAGGTGNCVRYAIKKKKPVVNLWGAFKEGGLV